jgi:hypothetical protein
MGLCDGNHVMPSAASDSLPTSMDGVVYIGIDASRLQYEVMLF